MNSRTPLAALALLTVSACSTMMVRAAPSELDAAAKAFEAVPDQAVVYVYRSGWMGGDYTTKLLVNEQVVGIGARGRYNRFTFEPGTHLLGVTSDYQDPRVETLALDLGAQSVSFVKEVYEIGPGFVLETAPPEEAKRTIARAKLSAPYEEQPKVSELRRN